MGVSNWGGNLSCMDIKWFYTRVTGVINPYKWSYNLIPIIGEGRLCSCICELLLGRERAGSVESVASLPSTARSDGCLAETYEIESEGYPMVKVHGAVVKRYRLAHGLFKPIMNMVTCGDCM